VRQGAGNVASNQANIVTIPAYGGFASVQPVSPMAYNRSYANSVILADGKIIVLGGQVRK
jgi:type II secretory pathway component GspD/PulD (secretin)